jgi:site-specific recombinase XerD
LFLSFGIIQRGLKMGIYKRGKTWYLDYYVHGKRKRERVGPNKRLAELAMEKIGVQLAEGRFLDIRKGEKVTFDEIAQDFLNYSQNNKVSYNRDIILVKNLVKFFGGKRLAEISPILIEQYKGKRLREGKMPATVNREVACLKCMFNWAIKNDKAAENPVRRVKLLNEDNTRTRYLSPDEMKRLLDACSECMKRIVICALLTGMRKSEIISLEWDDLNIAHGTILVKHTKTRKMREIPISRPLEKVILECHNDMDGIHVFCNEKGRAYRKIDTLFESIVKRANIQDFTFHDLRHTAASYMVMSGIDLATVKEILGHQKIDMTLRYAHLTPVHKREAMEILGSRMVTNWSQKAFEEEFEKSRLENNIDKIKALRKRRGTQVAKGEVCKTFIRRFESAPRLQKFLAQ